MPFQNVADSQAAPQRVPQRVVSLFETTEPELAVAFYAEVYGPNSLQLQSDNGLAMSFKGLDFANLHLAAVRHGAPTLTQVHDRQPHFVFGYMRRGQAERNGVRFNAGDAGMSMPGDTFDLRLSADAEIINLRVTSQDLCATHQALMGSAFAGVPQFNRHTPVTGSAVSALLRVMDHLAATPAYAPRAARHLERNLQDAALIELLLAWPNSHQDRLDQPAALPLSTRRARDFIHARIGDLPSVADVALACGIGMRALTRGFEKHIGTSPLQYMLELRLQGVHADLIAARDGASVTDLALQWGFSHLGQFAARYRQRFGESPRETLRRAGG